MFGGNSNWRGPIWMPVNVMLIRALLNFYAYYGDTFKIECPTGSGTMMNLFEVAKEISDRLTRIFLRDDNGELRAGLDGFTWGGYAKVEYLWVEESLRGRGLGRRLMEAAIDEARERGCDVIVVDTHTFQAPGLYRTLGFEEVGRTEGTPRGWGQVYFARSLTPGEAPA